MKSDETKIFRRKKMKTKRVLALFIALTMALVILPIAQLTTVYATGTVPWVSGDSTTADRAKLLTSIDTLRTNLNAMTQGSQTLADFTFISGKIARILDEASAFVYAEGGDVPVPNWVVYEWWYGTGTNPAPYFCYMQKMKAFLDGITSTNLSSATAAGDTSIYTNYSRVNTQIANLQALYNSMTSGTTAGTYPAGTVSYVLNTLNQTIAARDDLTVQTNCTGYNTLLLNYYNVLQWSILSQGGVRNLRLTEDDIPPSQMSVVGSGTITLSPKVVVGNDASLNVSIDNGTCLGLTPAPTSSDTVAGALPLTLQVETANVVGTITQAGNATVVVTAAGMAGSPITLNVSVANNDTAAQVASKIKNAMTGNTTINAFFNISLAGITVPTEQAKIFDGDFSTNTNFNVSGTYPGTSVVVDLGNTYDIDKVSFVNDGNNSNAPATFTISVSTDGITYFDNAYSQVKSTPTMLNFTATGRPGTKTSNGAYIYGDFQLLKTYSNIRYVKVNFILGQNGTVNGLSELRVKKSNYLKSAGLSSKAYDTFDNGSNDAAKLALNKFYTLAPSTSATTLIKKIADTNDTTLNVSVDNGTCAGLTVAPTSTNTTLGVMNTTSQVETFTVAGTITTAGNAQVVVTAAEIPGGQLTLSVPVLVGDTASIVANKIRNAIRSAAVMDNTGVDSANGWASGWSSDKLTYTTSVDPDLRYLPTYIRTDSYVTSSGSMFYYNPSTASTPHNIISYRKLSTPIDLSKDATYYVYYSFFNTDNYGGYGCGIYVGNDITLWSGSGSASQLTFGGTTSNATNGNYGSSNLTSVLVKIDARSTGLDTVSAKFNMHGVGEAPAAINTTSWDVVKTANLSSSEQYIGIRGNVTQPDKYFWVTDIGYGAIAATSANVAETNIKINELKSINLITTPQYSVPDSVTYTSSNPLVAEIQVDGISVRGVGEGRAVITGTINGSIVSKAYVNVLGYKALDSFNSDPDTTMLKNIANTSTSGFSSGWFGEINAGKTGVDTSVNVDDRVVIKTLGGKQVAFFKPGLDALVPFKAYRNLSESIDFSKDGAYQVNLTWAHNESYGVVSSQFEVGPNIYLKLNPGSPTTSKTFEAAFKGDNDLSFTPQKSAVNTYANGNWQYVDIKIKTSATASDEVIVSVYELNSVNFMQDAPTSIAANSTPKWSYTFTQNSNAVVNYVGLNGAIRQATEMFEAFTDLSCEKLPLVSQKAAMVVDTNGNKSIKATYTNNTANTYNYKLIYVTYVDGRVNSISNKTLTISPNSTTDISTDALTLSGPSYKLKCYVWDDLDGLKPIFADVSFDKNGNIQ
jgi:hypothetical protein